MGGRRNVVSERLVQRAKAAICSSVRPTASSTTATGFPRVGVRVKTSTWANGRDAVRSAMSPWRAVMP
ncbi:Uncharacterised protein [Mycobacteroides abscessus]|nr:Uncharacterised protein [Mycobacteroides abscessus]